MKSAHCTSLISLFLIAGLLVLGCSENPVDSNSDDDTDPNDDSERLTADVVRVYLGGFPFALQDHFPGFTRRTWRYVDFSLQKRPPSTGVDILMGPSSCERGTGLGSDRISISHRVVRSATQLVADRWAFFKHNVPPEENRKTAGRASPYLSDALPIEDARNGRTYAPARRIVPQSHRRKPLIIRRMTRTESMLQDIIQPFCPSRRQSDVT